MTTKIFISYRRADEPGYASAIHIKLTQFFDREDVFMDVAKGIPIGARFREVIEASVRACDVMLVIIGPEWTNLLVDRSNGEAIDYIELETRLALQLDKQVIPVLVADAQPPEKADLPETLWPLTEIQAHQVRPESLSADILALINALKPQAPLWRRLLLPAGGGALAASFVGGFLYIDPMGLMGPQDRATCLTLTQANMSKVVECYQDFP
ncbi:MAG: toll/interleukin-1 receptor domain-containing protein [Pseudomonadota bacterium]